MHMKYILILSCLWAFSSCIESKKEEPAMIKKVICGDSVVQMMYDENGKEWAVKVPGKCDTILEKAPEH